MPRSKVGRRPSTGDHRCAELRPPSSPTRPHADAERHEAPRIVTALDSTDPWPERHRGAPSRFAPTDVTDDEPTAEKRMLVDHVTAKLASDR